MHIFIDESGTFVLSAAAKNISVVGALIIPDERLPFVERRYARIRADLPKSKGEVKGRLLSESQIDRVVSMLAHNEVLFELIAIDFSGHSRDEIINHQRAQEAKITENLTDRHSDAGRAYVWSLRRRLEGFPLQLYVQSIVTFKLIATVLDNSTLYYAQRRPQELGNFHWVIDGKDRLGAIDWEVWWSEFIMPWLQTKSITEPLKVLRDADYSHFRRFDAPLPDYLKPLFPEPDHGNTDIKAVMTESFRFSSKAEPGLEMVDILANATRRALVGNLQRPGWINIPRLMIHTGEPYVQFVGFGNAAGKQRVPYGSVLRFFRQGGRDMLAPRFRG